MILLQIISRDFKKVSRLSLIRFVLAIKAGIFLTIKNRCRGHLFDLCSKIGQMFCESEFFELGSFALGLLYNVPYSVLDGFK